MAQDDEPDLDPDAEYAASFSKLHGLTPPVDIEEILREFADIEEDNIPHGCDGLLIRRTGRRPLVLVSRGQIEVRRRFTLAHELGHIVLPWQIGTFLCQKIESASRTEEDIAHQWTALSLEASANTFAGELIFPTRWINSVFRSAGDSPLEALAEIAAEANGSIAAALVAVKRVYSVPARFLVVNVFDGIDSQASTKTSRIQSIPDLSQETLGEYERAGAVITEMPYSAGRKIVCLHYAPDSGHLAAVPDRHAGVHSTNILRGIISEVYPDLSPAEAARMVQSINGMIGAANLPKFHQTIAQLVTAFRIRFASKTQLKEAMGHADFGPFLTRKAEEVLAKRQRE